MEKQEKNNNETQAPVDGIVMAHELTENGTRLIIMVGEMQSIPRNVKIVW